MSRRGDLRDLELAAVRASLGSNGGRAVDAVGNDHIGLVFTREGAAVRCGDSIPEAIATELAQIVAAAGASTDLAKRAVPEAVCTVVRPWSAEMRVEGGPMFVFDNLPLCHRPPECTWSRRQTKSTPQHSRRHAR